MMRSAAHYILLGIALAGVLVYLCHIVIALYNIALVMRNIL